MKPRRKAVDEMTGQTRWKRRVGSRGDSRSWRAALAITLAALVLLGACQGGEQNGLTGGGSDSLPPFKPVASVHQLMHDVVYPNAEIVWESVGTIISYEGTEEIFPRNDQEWEAVERSALTLTEAGNLLMIEGRAKDTGDWMERARALDRCRLRCLGGRPEQGRRRRLRLRRRHLFRLRRLPSAVPQRRRPLDHAVVRRSRPVVGVPEVRCGNYAISKSSSELPFPALGVAPARSILARMRASR